MRPIDADALIEKWRKQACEDCDKRKGWKNGKTVGFIYDIGEAPCRACWIDDMLGEIEDAPTVNEWISVKERLPEAGKWELVWAREYAVPCEAFYESGSWITDQFEKIDVTHWMPLPELPEVEG